MGKEIEPPNMGADLGPGGFWRDLLREYRPAFGCAVVLAVPICAALMYIVSRFGWTGEGREY